MKEREKGQKICRIVQINSNELYSLGIKTTYKHGCSQFSHIINNIFC